MRPSWRIRCVVVISSGAASLGAVVRWEVPPSRRVAFVAVLLVMVAAVLVTVGVGFRQGGYLLAASLALAAVLRASLPDRYCLGLLVRGKVTDVVTASVLAVAVAVVTGLVPG
jgi:hypothetical protein